MGSKTCILFFSRSPEEEKAYKKLNKSDRTSNQIIHKMYNHSLQVIKSTGLDYICYDEKLQKGYSFGARLSNAIEDVFQEYEQVIIVGNDCPNLHKKDIVLAEKAFDENSTTLGMTKQGGVFLIGLSKSKWDRNSFEQLAWNTHHLGAELLHILSKDQALFLLDSKSELNSSVDFIHFLESALNSSFVKELLALYIFKYYTSGDRPLQFRMSIQQATLFRGPPLYIAA